MYSTFWELRSYRSLRSLGVKPLVKSIGYKRKNIWLNSLTPNKFLYLRKFSSSFFTLHSSLSPTPQR